MYFLRISFILTILQIVTQCQSIRIDCQYSFHHYDVMGSIYQCRVDSYFSISTRESAKIDMVSGVHAHIHNNNDVTGFVADHKSLRYFPQGLDIHYKNLQLIRIRFTSIHEVSQEDFKPFVNLKELDMHENKITVLEDGLFDYNPKLVFVSFSKNQIYRIGSTVFDNLSNLKYLYLTHNECIDEFANNDRDLVQLIVDRTKDVCNKKEEPSTTEPQPQSTTTTTTITEDSDYYDEDISFDEFIPPRSSYRTSGSTSSLQIMFIFIFVLAIAAAGGVFYFLSAYGYRF
ncbi:uncharacterized protein [Chironomus tepperi]|uniref:uncharacterized protein n=1 Tax=Chironomus tepperi TaxID=113505 RepID=UPI00391FA375